MSVYAHRFFCCERKEKKGEASIKCRQVKVSFDLYCYSSIVLFLVSTFESKHRQYNGKITGKAGKEGNLNLLNNQMVLEE